MASLSRVKSRAKDPAKRKDGQNIQFSIEGERYSLRLPLASKEFGLYEASLDAEAKLLDVDPHIYRRCVERTRQIQIALARGNERQAHAALDGAIRELRELDGDATPWAERGLAALDIPARAANVLENHARVLTVGDLRSVTLADMLRIPNFGPKTLELLWKQVVVALCGGEDGSGDEQAQQRRKDGWDD